MAFLVSPGVQVKEIDLTNVVPAVSSSTGAIAGSFIWGPSDEITTVGSEKQLVEVFGQPDDNTYHSVLSAAQFLSYGNSLRVVRAIGSSALNATSGTTGLLIKNNTHAESVTTGQDIVARYPGVTGNALGISVCPAGSTPFSAWSWASNFSAAPGTSSGAAAVSGSNDEVHVVVYDATGGITGTINTVLEKYEYVSQGVDSKDASGSSNYVKDVINNKSAWVRIVVGITGLSDFGDAMAGTTFDVVVDGTSDNIYTKTLSHGVDDNALTAGETTLALDMFSDAETVDVSLLMMSDVNLSATDSTTVNNKLISIAEARKDCVAFVSPYFSADTSAEVITWAGTLTHSSYAFADSSALYVYDKYNDKYRWLGASSTMAGLSAHTDLTADAWFSPAGFSRGNLRNVVKLAYNPKQTDRDDLYKVGVNPIVTFPGAGTVLYGDKTLQTKPSAFDRINVRRLFIVLEKAIATASKASLFEFNDEFTRAQFRNMVEPFLRDVKGRRGVTDFKVVCDDTNNTGDIIDTNRFVADIYIKPARSINFITLNFVATRTGVEFSEIAGGN
jgi:phage tail sheath protein FI